MRFDTQPGGVLMVPAGALQLGSEAPTKEQAVKFSVVPGRPIAPRIWLLRPMSLKIWQPASIAFSALTDPLKTLKGPNVVPRNVAATWISVNVTLPDVSKVKLSLLRMAMLIGAPDGCAT